MKKLKVVASDRDLANNEVFDENGKVIGIISELVIRPKRTVIAVHVSAGVSVSDIESIHDQVTECLELGREVMTTSDHVSISTIEVADNIPVAFYENDGEGVWLNKEELDIKDVIE